MEIRVSELNQNISAVIAKAQTEEIIITKHGKAVAVLINPEKYQGFIDKLSSQQTFQTAYDFFKTLPKVDAFELPEREAFDLRDINF